MLMLSGSWFSFASFVYALYVVLAKFMLNKLAHGWTSLIVVVLLASGVQIMMLGIVGEYIARVFDESKNRPLYNSGKNQF